MTASNDVKAALQELLRINVIGDPALADNQEQDPLSLP